MKNYKVFWVDWFENWIEKTEDEVDNINVFKTFPKAKSSLLKAVINYKNQVQYKITSIREADEDKLCM